MYLMSSKTKKQKKSWIYSNGKKRRRLLFRIRKESDSLQKLRFRFSSKRRPGNYGWATYRNKKRNRIRKAVTHWALIAGVCLTSIIFIGKIHYLALIGDIIQINSSLFESQVLLHIPKEEDPGVIDRIRQVIKDRGFERGSDLISIIQDCENRALDPFQYHINRHRNEVGEIVSCSVDRGIAMFSDIHQPDVSDECAFTLECAINKMIDKYYEWGSFDAWVCAGILNIK